MINSTGFTINNVTYRALEAQVKKNQEDIAEHKRITQVLADLGIRVIGVVATEEDLPELFEGEYGDTYLVGTQVPYDLWVWTRPDINSGHPEAYWLNVGPISVVGPQGAQGPEGPQGPRGYADKWYVSTSDPYDDLDSVYSAAINTSTGVIFKRENDVWIAQTSIMGPRGATGPQGPRGLQGERGPQGERGETGVAGNAVTVIDILNSITELPDPNTVPRDSAYLVVQGDTKYIYIITGTENDLMWTNVGIFGGGTVVTNAIGTPITLLNIDNYALKPTTAPSNSILVANAFIPGNNYSQTTLAISNTPAANAIAQYDTSGNLATGYPVDSNDCVNTQYLDLKFYAKAPDTYRGAGEVPYYFYLNGAEHLTYAKLFDTAEPGAIAKRDSNGNIPLPDSQTLQSTNRALSMRTAMNNFTRTLYRHNKTLEIHVEGFDLVLKWEELKPTYTANNFSNIAGQVPTSAIVPARYLICSGFALDGDYTTLATSFKLSGSSLQLNGVSAYGGVVPGAAARTFSRPLTINLNDYSGTAGAITVTDEVSNI